MRKAGGLTGFTPYAALIALALVLRLGAIAATPGFEPKLDAAHYDGLACLLAHGEGYSLRVPSGRSEDSCGRMPEGENPPTAFRPPGWPAVLAAVTAVAEPERWTVARLLQTLIGTAAVALIGLAGFLLLGPPGAVAAAALAAVDTTLLVVGASLMSEPLFVALVAAAVCAALAARRVSPSPHGPGGRRWWAWVAAAGLLLGLATLVRSNGPAVLPAVALLAATGWRRALAAAVVAGAALVLVVAPWTVRNAVVMDAFVPVASYVGTGLAGTFNDQARTREDHPGAWLSPRHVPAYRDIHLSGMSEIDKQRELRRRAIEYAKDHPLYVPEAAARNVLRVLSLQDLSWHRGSAESLSLPRWTGPFAAAGFWVLLLLAAASLLGGAHRQVPAALWLGPVLLMASAVVAGGEMRYRAPVVPFLILLSAPLLVRLGDARRSSRP